jgi:hypothetical protein
MLETWLREGRVRLSATSQLCFCSLIFVDYVLILYDYQMAFSPICSVAYALGLVRLISRCASVLYAPQSLSARARFADPVQIPLRPCLPCSCLHHAVLLVNTSGISCHVRRFIRHAVDYSRVIAGYSLNFP